ncbi:A disintegrin and metalloproteinase with thrombospondin motifs 13-like [Haliotis rubra]|uniref:A disintegrin and metalloproteinase with thrombospondin motifs 13-like n=1 Tax=Haliotis rubra TaxID=36100 RepID=UPI001EE50CFC|nr:A disintegrin and metalloproteinase with thrombospondin motifs 13-like [Haliotis rubra]
MVAMFPHVRGGVRMKTRKCDTPRPLFGGKKCEGIDSKAELCNVEPCSTSQYRYKEEQCAATDIYPVDGRRLHWLPGDTVGDSVCMLYCSPVGDETIHLRGSGRAPTTRTVLSVTPTPVAPTTAVCWGSAGRLAVMGSATPPPVSTSVASATVATTPARRRRGVSSEGRRKAT